MPALAKGGMVSLVYICHLVYPRGQTELAINRSQRETVGCERVRIFPETPRSYKCCSLRCSELPYPSMSPGRKGGGGPYSTAMSVPARLTPTIEKVAFSPPSGEGNDANKGDADGRTNISWQVVWNP